MTIRHASPLLTTLLLGVALLNSAAQTSTFTYQGSLEDNGGPATGIYDFKFSIYDLDTGGTEVGGPLTNAAVPVNSGLFTVTLDFGAGAFNGSDRWLEIGVSTNGGGTFNALNPRQQVTSAPYAITAGTITGALPSGSLSGSYGEALNFSNPANTFVGDGSAVTNVDAKTLDGLSAEAFWQLDGNTGITPGTHFLGTTGNQPVEIRVNNTPGFRVEYPTTGSTPNVIGGSSSNNIANGTEGAVIVGGGSSSTPNIIGSGSTHSAIIAGQRNTIAGSSGASTIAGGWLNDVGFNASFNFIGNGFNNNIGEASDHCGIVSGDRNNIGFESNWGTVGGGRRNVIGDNANGTTISGGQDNDLGADTDYSTIGGGQDNNVGNNSFHATIAGGFLNDIGVNSDVSVIGGGQKNLIDDTATYSTISGGLTNTITGNARHGTIGGGQENQIGSQSWYVTVSGGLGNQIGENSGSSMIGGGQNNRVGDLSLYSTVAGGSANEIRNSSGASAIGGGFQNTVDSNSVYAVIAGGNLNYIGDDADYCTIGGGNVNEIGDNSDESVIGGGQDNDIADNAPYSTIPGGRLNRISAGATNAFAAGSFARADHQGTFVWADSQNAWFPSSTNDEVSFRCLGGVRFTSGGVAANQTVSWTPGSASWSFTSDRDTKENLQPVDTRAVLEGVSQMPLLEWNYIGHQQRHMGPMAQDFHVAFPWSGDELTLNSADLHGVSLAAIQGLNEKLECRMQEAELRNEQLREELARKGTEVAELKKRLHEIEQLLLSRAHP